MRQSPNLRYTARERPQRRQRLCARVGYFGLRLARTIMDVFAICSSVSLCRHGLACERLEAGRAPLAGERHAERVEEGERLRVGLRGRREGHVEPAHLVDVVVVDLREDDLLPDAHVVVAATVE